MSDVGDDLLAGFEELAVALEKCRDMPVWGVVSTYAADTLYDHPMTFQQAKDFAKDQAREEGRTARIVLLVPES